MKFRVVLLCLALSSPALAYLDPVTGNIIVQVVLVAFTSIALGFNRLKLWVLGLMGKKPSQKQEESSSEEGSEEKSESDQTT